MIGAATAIPNMPIVRIRPIMLTGLARSRSLTCLAQFVDRAGLAGPLMVVDVPTTEVLALTSM
jgi:hypothetical protein